MVKVISIRTGEEIECRDRDEAERTIRLAVMVTNERIRLGIYKGKRDNKNNYIIAE